MTTRPHPPLPRPRAPAVVYPAMDGRREVVVKAHKGEVITRHASRPGQHADECRSPSPPRRLTPSRAPAGKPCPAGPSHRRNKKRG